MSQTPPLQVVGSGGRLGGARGASSRQLDLAVFTTDTASALKKNRGRRGAAAPGCGERAAPLEDRAPAEA